MLRSCLQLLIIMLPLLTPTVGCNSKVSCLVPPTITGNPANQTVGVGQLARFTVAAAGSALLSYQWMKNGQLIPGATQASYVTPASSSTDSGSIFTVTASNGYGIATSSPASLTVSSPATINVRFVAPSGNDSSVGSIDQPFLTIQHCADSVDAGSICEVRAGTYRETVTPTSGITIEAYNSESVTVDGSDPVTGWTPFQGSIYQAHVVMEDGDTNQVFVGTDMMTEARWPNGDDLFHVNWATAQAGTDSGHIADSNLPSVDWTGAHVHLWSGANAFSHQTGTVTSSGIGQVSIDVGQSGTCPYICPVAGGYYYLYGLLSALDTTREWFYDSKSATLYFMAPAKANPNTLDVRSKQRQYAFDLRGKIGVKLTNINVFASTIITDSHSANNTLDRISAQYVSHFTALPVASSGLPFSILLVHATDSGIVIKGTGNTVQNSTISYSAGAGVSLEGDNNRIQNNLIKNIDYVGDYASGIDLDGNGNIVRNNTINSVGRQSIYMVGVLNQDIAYNNLFDSMMLSTDGAAIYACCNQLAAGTRIHHNWIHDTSSIKSGNDSVAISGIYIDNGSSGFNVDQNILWNNQHRNIVLNGLTNSGVISNYLHNNSIPSSPSDGQISIQNVSNCTETRIVDNRVVIGVDTSENAQACVPLNNTSSAPGATEMTPTTQVGCNFEGCSTNPPPAIIDGSVTPCPVTNTLNP